VIKSEVALGWFEHCILLLLFSPYCITFPKDPLLELRSPTVGHNT
jgi:hypothetical protein